MDFFNSQLFHVDTTLHVYHDKEKYRSLTLERLQALLKSGLVEETFQPKRYIELFNKIHLLDGSFAVKVGVNFGLFGISILKLGTEKHQHFVQKLVKGEILGAFAMTEVNHGSDVKNIKTTAIYNNETKTFTINSNGEMNRKCWIGNALHATHAVVFAQLIFEKNYGIHAFVVDLKNVKRFDLGDKIGLQGVDNGMLEFENVIVPYDALLDRFSKIEDKFISSLNNDKRFGSMLSALTLGRVAISSGVLQFLKKSLYIAIHYAMKRKQFSFFNKEETFIIEYPSLYMRLLPTLCSVFVFEKFISHLVNIYENNTDKVHKISSGCKPYLTWFCLDGIQQCREACGGNGYSMKNQFGILKNDADIYTTFEGDNHVLLQMLGKILLSKYGKRLKKSPSYYGTLLGKVKNQKAITEFSVPQVLQLMKYKYLKKLLSVLTSFYNQNKTEKNYMAIWNSNQQHVIDFCTYYIEYKIAKIAYDAEPICYHVHLSKWIIDNRYYLISNRLISKSLLTEIEKRHSNYIIQVKNNIYIYLNQLGIEPYMISKL